MPTFRLSLLSINQLDTARYTSTFGPGKCSISSPSITITGNRVNDLYIISPANALTSTVPSMSTKSTSRRRKKKRNRGSSSAHTTVSSSSAHITVPSSSAHTTVQPSSAHTTGLSIAHSTERTTSPLHTASPRAASAVPQSPPTTRKSLTKTTRKPLTISESRLWHRRLAYIHPIALQSLIDRYTKDDSMCTACIHKQKIIKVKTKRPTKPFELVHSDVCGPFSTPSSSGIRYCILFINNYTRYTYV
jgi:hypothetical protein